MTKCKETALGLVNKYACRCPYELCEMFSIKVMEFEMPENINGFYAIIKNKPVIYLDSELDSIVKAQVAAHELGHVLLHGEKNLLFLSNYTLFVPSKYEREADTFAAYLLADKDRLDSYGDKSITTEQLSAICGISLQMAEILAQDKEYFTS